MKDESEIIIVARGNELRQIVREEIRAAQMPDKTKEFSERMTRMDMQQKVGR
ncbi:MAG: hypothetical protein HQ522_12420 [Bacteroidetes bacterium]|nr:hypothetical protein [Bacteroidota bacterium]